jgi:nucleotide-binding universal stress UspA family protein
MALDQRILVPVDGSESSNRALAAALQLAQAGGGRIRVLHVVDELAYLSPYADPAATIEDVRAKAGQVLDAAVALGKASTVPVDRRLVEAPGRRLGDVVADEANAWEADLIVIGTHGRRGLQRLLLGSGAEQILRLAPVPVLVVRDAAPSLHAGATGASRSPYQRILVPVDGSEPSNRALVEALQLARTAGGRVRVVHDVNDLAYLVPYEGAESVIEQARTDARQVIDAALAVCQSAGVPADSEVVEEAGRRLGDAVAEAARGWNADLVVIGTHGRRGMQRLLLGSGAEEIIRLASVPVLVVRQRGAAAQHANR